MLLIELFTMDSQPGFMEAVQRARQVAERMQQQKRSLESSGDDDAGKRSRPDNGSYGPSSVTSPPSNSQSDSSQGALDPLERVKAIAAKLNQEAIVAKGGPPTAVLDANSVHDEFWVPEKLVGLVIGKGGETITRLQQESGAHMQVEQGRFFSRKISFDSNGYFPISVSNGGPERRCLISGPKDAVERIKNMLRQLVAKGQAGMGGGLPPGHIVEEIMIPGTLVGIVIGKGGEQIKQMQEQCGVKMVLIQDSHEVTSIGKPLRITGDSERVRNAKDVVQRLLSQKDDQTKGRGRKMGEYGSGDGPGNGYAVGTMRSTRVEVPHGAVGGIIGKGGEMIRRISQDFGNVKIQFASDSDPTGGKTLEIGPGPAQAVDDCAACVRRLTDGIITTAKARNPPDPLSIYQQIKAEMPAGSYGSSNGGYSGPDPSKLNPYDQTEIFFPIPFRKAGYVIGKGGATIHEIIRESGAHVEVLRDNSEKELIANGQQPETKTFRIKGMVSQIESALRIITDKAGVQPPPGWCTQPQDLASLYAYSLANHGSSDAAAAAVAAAVDPMAHYYYQSMYQQGDPNAAAATGGYPPASQAAVAPTSQSAAPTDPSQASNYPAPSKIFLFQVEGSLIYFNFCLKV